MKILTITGTRPELIRLSVILKKLDKLCDHVHVYTMQNYDPNLSTLFLKELGIRVDYLFNKTEGLASFLANGFLQLNDILNKEKPDKVLVLGDTNSCLLALLAAKRGIPVFHMEAGNRCYDDVVPEETNRRVLDSLSYYNLPYNESSKENLLFEGHHKNRVFKVGNPINEVLDYYKKDIMQSSIIQELGLGPWEGGAFRSFILLSFHRTENVDNPHCASQVVAAINKLAEETTVVFPLHPRTADQFRKHGIVLHKNVKVLPPIGFFDFVRLEMKADVVITDSGTVPEERYLMAKRCVVLRNTTERQELMELGTFVLAGYRTEDILRAVQVVSQMKSRNTPLLEDYRTFNVSDSVIAILLGQSIKIERRGHDEY